MTYTISLEPGELDLRQCVSCGQVFLWRETAPDLWLGVDGEAWFRVQVTPDGLNVESNVPSERFRRLFNLDVDQAEQEEAIRAAAPELDPYIARFPGLRLMRPSCPVETLCCFLCTPNNHLRRIMPMARALQAYGEPIGEVEGVVLRRFPEIEAVASIPEHELRAMGFGYRARSIPLTAARVAERGGREWLMNLRAKTYAEAFEALVALPGVGPKLADCIALFALHKTEAVPVDTHLWQAATRLYFPEWRGAAITESRYRAVGALFRAKFGPLAGIAHHYLFYDNMRNAGRSQTSGTLGRKERIESSGS